MLLSLDAQEVEVFNFGITKISVTTEITKFHEIQPKFHQNFLETSTLLKKLDLNKYKYDL